MGVHVTARLLDWRGLTLAYAPELVPLLLVSENPTYRVVSSPFGAERVQTGVANVAGFGLSPVGFEGRLRLSSRVRLHAATASGVVVFTRAAPTPDARRVNFTFEFGGGCDLALRAGWWLRVAAKRHHFSNANSARDNPGVDATVVTVGLARGIGTR